MNRIAIYFLTRQGAALGTRLRDGLGGVLFGPGRFAAEAGAEPFDSLAELAARTFREFDGHVFIAAAGIAVRTVAPLLRSKAEDPGVVVVDQAGRFAVSLLSGHLGGGNDLARRVAALSGGQSVVTTATDTANLPSLELVARERGLAVENLGALKYVSGALLDGRAVPLYDPENRLGMADEPLFTRLDDPALLPLDGPAVAVTHALVTAGGATLVLRPRCLAAGIGCRRGTEAEEIEALVRAAFSSSAISPASLAVIGTIEAKRDEEGLLRAAERLGACLAFFSADELNAQPVPSGPGAALKYMGVGSVCEAAAMLLSRDGTLLMTKAKTKNATLAVSLVG